MKKLMSIVISLLFALSMTGLAFAQASTDQPSSEPTVKVEKAEKKKVKKAKKAKKVKKAKKAKKARKARKAAEKKAEEAAPAEVPAAK